MNKILTILALCTCMGCTKAIIDETTVDELPPLERDIFYSPDVANVLINNCITCHQGTAASAGVDLSDYNNVRFYTESGNLLDRINDPINPMPPNGQMSAEEIQIITKWAQDGFPQ